MNVSTHVKHLGRELSYSRVVEFIDVTDATNPQLAPGVQGQGT